MTGPYAYQCPVCRNPVLARPPTGNGPLWIHLNGSPLCLVKSGDGSYKRARPIRRRGPHRGRR